MLGGIGRRKTVDHFPGPHQIQFFAGDLFQVTVVVAQAGDALAQRFVFLLQAKILFVELRFLDAQAPEMERAALPDDNVNKKQQDRAGQ
jgi:hypothetical protein